VKSVSDSSTVLSYSGVKSRGMLYNRGALLLWTG
jgi:hypothetical protein